MGDTHLCSNILMNAAAVWPAINKALYIPVLLNRHATAYQMGVIVGTQSGNLDVGIYDMNGVRLVSAGSTAVAAAGLQIVNITDTPLSPGLYYLAMCVDNTTAAFNRGSVGAVQSQVSGMQEQAVGAVTLPSTATFANPAASYCPVIMASLVATL